MAVQKVNKQKDKKVALFSRLYQKMISAKLQMAKKKKPKYFQNYPLLLQ